MRLFAALPLFVRSGIAANHFLSSAMKPNFTSLKSDTAY
jgi:hypothetical protein